MAYQRRSDRTSRGVVHHEHVQGTSERLVSLEAARENVPSIWNVDTLKDYLDRNTMDADRRTNEHITDIDRRTNDHIDDMDRRYEERYLASQTALQAALLAQKEAFSINQIAAEKGVNTALAAAEKAVSAALAAADRAVAKAEMAADKRFEQVNEFRATLADQQRTLMPRAEVEVLMKAMTEKIELTSRGITSLVAERRGSWATGHEIGPYLLAAISVAIAIFLHYVKQ